MSEEIIRSIIIFAPFFSALFAFAVICFELYEAGKQSRKSVKILLIYFICIMISFFSIFLYYYHPVVFVYINSIVMLSFVLIQILFFRFVFEITKLNKEDKFNKIHYVFPFLIFLIFVFAGLITPLEEQVAVVNSRGDCTGHSLFFCRISNSKFPVRFVLTIIYTFLCFKRLISYRKKVADFSANYEKSSLGWIRNYLILLLALIPIPLMGILINRDELTTSYLLLIQVFILFFQYTYICFHIIKGNYIIMESSESEATLKNDNNDQTIIDKSVQLEGSSTNEEFLLKKQLLNKELIEMLMQENKPYLNPNLKITDMIVYLNTNRSYLSSFINTEYGMNFSKFINQYRLSEYYSLKKDKAYSTLSEKELAELAGFGSYKNFKRFISD